MWCRWRVVLTATVSSESAHIGTGHVAGRSISAAHRGRSGWGGGNRFRGAPSILGVYLSMCGYNRLLTAMFVLIQSR